jgi:hypothetical protein
MSSNVEWPEAMRRRVAVADSRSGSRNNEQKCFLTESLVKRILRRVFPDQRKQQRQPVPPLVGYLGTAHSSNPYELGDISLTGFCLLTDERWIPGTEMPITLQRTNPSSGEDLDSFTVQATVERCGKEGVGFSVVLSEENSQAAYGNPLQVRWVTRAQMEEFLERLQEKPSSQEVNGNVSAPVVSTNGGTAGSRLNTVFEGGR